VQSAHHDLAVTQRRGIVLPLAGVALDDRVRLQPEDLHLRDVQLRRLRPCVARLGADEAIEVRFLDSIVVVQHVVLETYVGELLNQLRPAAAKAGDADRAARDLLFRLFAEKRLAREAFAPHEISPRSKTRTGAPITAMLLQGSSVGSPGR